jgi:gentisate 1,2-dioxygenase
LTLSVLKPGERTEPIRRNSTAVEFCIGGGGYAVVGGKRVGFSQYDVWNCPSWRTSWQVNDGADVQVRLTYSTRPARKLNVHLVEQNPRAGGRRCGGGRTSGGGPYDGRVGEAARCSCRTRR